MSLCLQWLNMFSVLKKKSQIMIDACKWFVPNPNSIAKLKKQKYMPDYIAIYVTDCKANYTRIKLLNEMHSVSF